MHRHPVIAVVGVPGSGAGELAQVLVNLGCELGSQHYRTILDGILEKTGSDWLFPHLPQGWSSEGLGEDAIGALRYLLRLELRECKSLAVEDPRLCLFPGIWSNALEDLELPAKVILVKRNSDDATKALVESEGLSHGNARWLVGEYVSYGAGWEDQSRFDDVISIRYEEIHQRHTYERISEELDLEFNLAEAWGGIESLGEALCRTQ